MKSNKKEFYRGITDRVREHGRAVLSIFAGDDGSPAFTYTIGNAERGGAELFVLGRGTTCSRGAMRARWYAR